MLFAPWLRAIVQSQDIVMGFAPPDGDPEVQAALDSAGARGAITFALPGTRGSYSSLAATSDPFIHQEIIEILYHTLWETVRVFFKHRELGQDVGAAGFLYPFLGQQKQATDSLVDEVAASIRMKVAEDTKLREQTAREQAGQIATTTAAIRETSVARWETHTLWKWRLGYGRERLGAGLCRSTCWLSADQRRGASGAQSGSSETNLYWTLCHREAAMVDQALAGWNLAELDFLFIEMSATWCARLPMTWAKTCAWSCSPSPKARTSH